MAALLRTVLPFSNAPVGSGHRGLDVDGVVPQPPQLQSLIQCSHNVQGIVALWGQRRAGVINGILMKEIVSCKR